MLKRLSQNVGKNRFVLAQSATLMPKCDRWEQQTQVVRSCCDWIGRNDISRHLSHFVCWFFFFTGNVLHMWYTPWKYVRCNFDEWLQNLEISIPFMLGFYLLLTTKVECLRIRKHRNNQVSQRAGRHSDCRLHNLPNLKVMEINYLAKHFCFLSMSFDKKKEWRL